MARAAFKSMGAASASQGMLALKCGGPVAQAFALFVMHPPGVALSALKPTEGTCRNSPLNRRWCCLPASFSFAGDVLDSSALRKMFASDRVDQIMAMADKNKVGASS